MNLLSKEEIFAKDDRKTEDVAVPEWGGTVRVRSLSGTERNDLEASMAHLVGNKPRLNLRNATAKLVAMSAINADGSQLFDQADIIRLGNRNGAALQRLADACERLSGISEDDLKEMTEGFGDAPNGASTSVSPPTSADSPSPNSSTASPPTNSPNGVLSSAYMVPSAHSAPTSTPH